MALAKNHPKSVDEYLARIESAEARTSLSRLRDIIREEVPEAEEIIRYGIPTFKFHGYLASFAAFKGHCSFFPGHTVTDFSDALRSFKIAKGTVQFLPRNPIPEPLLRSMIRARRDENLAESSDKS